MAMLKPTLLNGVIGAGLLLLTAACDPAFKDQSATPQAIGMANPASLHCLREGGKSEIRRSAQGDEYGVCVFEDGRQCEEWVLFRDRRCEAPRAN